MLVFLATDNAEIKELLNGRYRAVLTTPHWYPAPGLPLHKSPDCPNRFESGVEALVDLYLLAECDHLICDASSSFARVAKLLTKAPHRQVIDVRPRPWHRRFRSFRTRARLRLVELRRGPVPR